MVGEREFLVGGGLFARFWAPERAKGTLAIVHGYGEHSGRYRDFSAWLAGRGWRVVACDLPGHGRSPGRRGHIRRFSDYLAAVEATLAAAGGAAPVFLLGHSLGGLIAASYLELEPRAASGLILSSPFFGLALPVPAWKRALAGMLSRLWPAASLPSRIRPEDLSHDPKVVEAYRRDPLVHRVATARWFSEVLAAQAAALRDAPKLQVPVLIVQGEEDRLAQVAATRAFAAACGSPDLTLKLYGGLYHETLNELGRERVWGDVLDWLEERRERV
ncbi:alpha/beta hydrolase [Candidatus Acetothermia bacterium]|nr:MAG: alpha/beta hydrolase [Candidatus Acetothermia bacterium]